MPGARVCSRRVARLPPQDNASEGIDWLRAQSGLGLARRGLSDDAVAQVGDAVGFDHAHAFEVELAIREVGEEANAVAEEDGDEVYVDLVEKAGPEVLLGDFGGADGDRPPVGNRAGLFEGALDAVGDDGSFGIGPDVLIGAGCG